MTGDYIQKGILETGESLALSDFQAMRQIVLLLVLTLASAVVISFISNRRITETIRVCGKCMSAFLLFYIIVSIVSSVLSRASDGCPETICTIIGYAAALVAFALYAKQKGISFSDFSCFYPQNTHPSSAAWCISGGIGSSLLVSSLLTMLSSVWQNTFAQYDSLSKERLIEGQRFINVIFVLIVAPVVEEIVYRGFLTKIIKKEISSYAAVIVPCVLFAWMHLPSFIWFVYALIFGIILSLISEKFNNITYSIMFHIGFNSVSAAAVLIPADTRLYDILYNKKEMTGIYMIIGILAAVLSAFKLMKVSRTKEED